jgi:predicted helicase
MYDIFPTPEHENIIIAVTGVGTAKPFSTLVMNCIPELQILGNGQCFPRYYYEKASQKEEVDLFEESGQIYKEQYIKRDAITDEATDLFKNHYADDSIGKDDLFYYIYGILHSPEYKERFGSTLKRMLPRIPFASDFWAFRQAGKKLMDLHVNYEDAEPYPVNEDKSGKTVSDYKVVKMSFGKNDGAVDKSVIIYSPHITIRNIPLEAYDYIVNGKSAIEWVMERYQVSTDKDSDIFNDPNEWSDNPRYIIDLLEKVINVSVKTVEIVKELPSIAMHPIK